jgi:hypothetical protein
LAADRGDGLFLALNIVARIWLPHEGARARAVLAIIEGIFLVVLITGNPVGASSGGALRRAALALVSLLVAGALWERALVPT